MRSYTLLTALCTLLLATFALGNPLVAVRPAAEAAKRGQAIAFGKANVALDGRERSGTMLAAKEATTNYLVTLERSITNTAKDNILDVLLRTGAVVKEEYNYRVYKGILFSVPSTSDKGLSSWQSSLVRQDGVKYVEADQLVKVQ
ncbi:hypothetical protein JCM11641_006570 [Rhodosporidiobolus odoratus]